MKASEAVILADKAQEEVKQNALKELPRLYDRIKAAAKEGKRSLQIHESLHEAVATQLRSDGYRISSVRNGENLRLYNEFTTTIAW